MLRLLIILLKTLRYGTIFMFFLLLGFSSCFNFRTSNRSELRSLKEKGISAMFFKDSSNGIFLNCLKTGNDTTNCVLFIHGAPGANDAFKEFMCDTDLIAKATLIAIDRPGYGYSSRDKTYYSIEEQSKAIGHLIRSLKSKYKKLVVMGHSYGATMVAKLCMDYSDSIDAAIQVSGAVDPDNEKMFWFSKFADSRFVYWSLSRTLKVCSNEKMRHAEDIRRYMQNWDSIRNNYTVIHGDKDNLVPYENLQYSNKHLKGKNVRIISVENGGHLLIWDHYGLLKKELLSHLK